MVNVLRRDLLQDRTIALAGGIPSAVRDTLADLGARVVELAPELNEETGAAWASENAPLHTLVFAAHDAFQEGGRDGLSSALDQAWIATRATATGAQIPVKNGGKIVLIAPGPQAGAYAEAVRSGLENLARTLSVEWARYGITATAIAPGEQTTDEQLGMLVSYWPHRPATTSAAAAST